MSGINSLGKAIDIDHFAALLLTDFIREQQRKFTVWNIVSNAVDAQTTIFTLTPRVIYVDTQRKKTHSQLLRAVTERNNGSRVTNRGEPGENDGRMNNK